MLENPNEDPMVVCATLYLTQKKELDARAYKPKPLSQTRAYRSTCKVKSIVDGKIVTVQAWKNRSNKWVREEDAAGVLAFKAKSHRAWLEREIASLDLLIADPIAFMQAAKDGHA